MSRQAFEISEQLSLALAATAYARREVRLAETDLGARTLLVSSRQGLFAADRHGVNLIAHGLFFGLTRRGADIYAFESCDLPRARTRLGRIVRLRIADRSIHSAEVVVEGLDNGCHQIDFVGDLLCVLDTYNQRILAFTPDGEAVEVPQPLAPAQWAQWDAGYAHANSILAVRDHILVLLHNGGRSTERPSAVLVLDKEWRPLGRWTLRGEGCHDLACLPDGPLLSCGSMAGELITLDGRHRPISTMMTRGLCVDADEIVVGASNFSARKLRGAAAGALHFLDADWVVDGTLPLVSAPTCLMKLEGLDYGISQPRDRAPRLPDFPFDCV